MGPLDLQNYYFEHRKQLADAMIDSKDIIIEISNEFEKISGRKYELFEKYMMEDSEIAIVVLNSTAGTAKDTIDELRASGIKAGLIKPRVFRPLPYKEIAESLKGLKAIAVMDKAVSINGMCGPLYSDISTALFKQNISIPTVNYIYGLGGRDVKHEHLAQVFNNLIDIAKTGKSENSTYYLGVRE